MTSRRAPRTALLAAGLLALGGCGAPAGTRDAAEKPVPVVLASVGSERLVERIEALGTAAADESIDVTARVTETVRALPFAEGSSVEAGAVIAELVSAEEAAALSQARALLAEAERQHRRTRELFDNGTETRASLDARLAARDAARARVEELEARLSDHLVRAPFSGVIGLRRVSPGALVRPGDVITTLDTIDPIKVAFSVPERWLGELRPGLEVEARAEAWPGRVFRGSIDAVDTRINARTRAVTARARLDNPEHLLRPGMLLAVELLYRARDALVVPEAALVPLGEEVFVFTVDADGRVHQVGVRTGQRRSARVEILEGLAAGDRVVVEGVQRIHPGTMVEPLEPASERGDVAL